MAINPYSGHIAEDKKKFLWDAENQEEEDFLREYTQGGVYPIQGYDNEGNKVPVSAYDRNQFKRNTSNARNVEMNQNDNIENGVGIENPLEIAAANEFGRGQGGDEGIDWLNMGRWGKSLGQSVQELPENLRGMLGWLIPGGIHNPGGGAEEESQEVPAIEESLYFNEDIMGG